MPATAAVTTAKGTAAISSIQLTGKSAKAIIQKIFKPHSTKKLFFQPSNILVGNLSDNDQVIDEVLIACQSPDLFTINCHGNPIIVEMIMKLLEQNGAQLITVEQMLKNQFAQSSQNTIDAEAKLYQLKAATLLGVKIIANQPDKGLAKTATQWLNNFETLSLQQIQNDCEKILTDSQLADKIINGVTIVIAGPPNSGKSTLLNCLSGRQKSIVTDTPGTTRDYVGSKCRLGPLLAEFIDTAGLDENLTISPVDAQAQKITRRLINQSDLVLLVLDGSEPLGPKKLTISKDLVAPERLLVVFNKSDLTKNLDHTCLDFNFADSVTISAKESTGIEQLSKKILKTLAVDTFDSAASVCFTQRQQILLQKILTAKAKSDTRPAITELLNAPICV
jgi:tRNA modification GTPase